MYCSCLKYKSVALYVYRLLYSFFFPAWVLCHTIIMFLFISLENEHYLSMGFCLLTVACHLSVPLLLFPKYYSSTLRNKNSLCWRLLVIYTLCYSQLHLEYFRKQYQKGFHFDCNLVPCLALFNYFQALLVEIDCGLIGKFAMCS